MTTSPQPAMLPDSQGSESTRIDVEQMFHLIAGVLSFEACLYHQVLPLRLEGSRLYLGMVDPDDRLAIDYVRRILAYLNCSLVPEPISSKTHQAMLSAYLNQTGKQSLSSQTSTVRSTPTVETKPVEDRQSSPTLVVDSPDQIEVLEPLEIPIPEGKAPPELPPPPPPPPLAIALPELEIRAQNLSSPVEMLAALPPLELMQELLGRVLVGGIGRLYFERHPTYGRILWSLNGVLQSVLDGLEPMLFQGVLNEFKRLTHLPMLPVQKPKQVEIERRYEQARLLLRLRVMPGKYGEEATLQVLRGAALKFYQQQQLATLGRDALTIAQQLQQKLHEIRDRARSTPALMSVHLEALPALTEMFQNLQGQLKDLEALKAQTEQEPQPEGE